MKLDKTRVAKFKKGEEPKETFYWLSKTPMERITTFEQVRLEYNTWKYGPQSGFQRIYRAVKRERS
ncbi:MAG: hypothetical protein AAFP89_10805 [Bacteroidota bacterium]